MSFTKSSAREKQSLAGLKKNLIFLTYEQRKQFIEKDNEQICLKRQAQLLDISRSGLYYQPRINQRDIAIMNLIDKIYTELPFYGSRRIRKELKIYHQVAIGREKNPTTDALNGVGGHLPQEKNKFFQQRKQGLSLPAQRFDD